ncbi:MAG: ectonucleotide pyrophosphatase/phosphodiesterase [Bacteroidales bacterium]
MLFLSLLLVIISALKSFGQPKEPNTVIMLSMDGFRWDYPEKAHTPVLDSLEKAGVRAEALIPSFPTKTFPNHYTIVTGLYPDHHGIVLNSFYNPVLGREYSISDRSAVTDGRFYRGEPVWVTAGRQGLKTASCFWVGSEAEINGYRPDYWLTYDHDMPYADRIDTVMAWLRLPGSLRPSLILWYLDQPDHDGHVYGPDAPETIHTVEYLDSLLGSFFSRLKRFSSNHPVDVIITSDHGMGEIREGQTIVLDDYLKPSWIAKLRGSNPNFLIESAPGCTDSILSVLRNVPGLLSWASEEVPAELHYGTDPSTLDIVLVAKEGWALVPHHNSRAGRGTHGYIPSDTDMHAIFYAAGPSFKSGVRIAAFPNIDIYPLLCRLLALKPAPVDGDIKPFLPVLK